MTVDLDTLSRGLDGVRALVTDPASNPKAALVFVAIVTVVLLIAVLTAVLIGAAAARIRGAEAAGAPDDGVDESEAEAERGGRRTRALLWCAVLSLLVGLVTFAALRYTSANAFCARCHHTERARETHAEGTHQTLSCAACHEAGGASTYTYAKARGLKNALATASGQTSAAPVPSVVADAACLSCHSAVTSGVLVSRSIRVRHAEVLEAGYRCIECHNTEGHGKAVARPRFPEMKYCIVCHDGSSASAACATCHPGDVGTASRKPRRLIPRVTIERENCRGCHSMQPCIDCHGIELPHSRRFVAGYHASFAYRDLDMCLSCHDIGRFCNNSQCHNFRADLVSEDGLRRVREQHAELMSEHSTSGPEECASCHGDPDVCRYCHGDVPEH